MYHNVKCQPWDGSLPFVVDINIRLRYINILITCKWLNHCGAHELHPEMYHYLLNTILFDS